MRDSAGNSTFFPPVAPEAASPPPPPTPATMAAPLPPPARPPISAPTTAPPPVTTAVRLPLPFGVDDCSRDVRALGDGNFVLNRDGHDDGGFKFVAGLCDSRTYGSRQNYCNGSARRDDDGLRGLRSGSVLL